jgi:Ca2+-binding RTX toxin-like protein
MATATPFTSNPITFTVTDHPSLQNVAGALLSGVGWSGLNPSFSAITEDSVFIPGYGQEAQDFTPLDNQQPVVPEDPNGDPDAPPALPLVTTFEKVALGQAMIAWQNVSGVNLTPVNGTGAESGNGVVGDIRVGKAPGATHTYDPDFHPRGGDIWFSTNFNADGGALTPAEQLTVLRQTGQALGLKMANETTDYNEETLDAAHNSGFWTIMSNNIPAGLTPKGPMVLDILAMQALYGAETTTGAGNSTYHVDGSLQTIVDVNGIDTLVLDAAGTIDLRGVDIPGADLHRSFLTGGLNDGTMIAFGNFIENAVGSAGNDTIWGTDIAGSANRNDIRGNGGNDIIRALNGDDRIQGNDGNDNIDAGAGNDLVYGQRGQDTIRLGTGKDTLVFNTVARADNVDRVLDFRPVDDTFNVDNAVFTAAGANGKLATGAFYMDTVGAAAAHDTTDRFIYSKVNGGLFYDPDGTGAQAQVRVATLNAGLVLTAADFLVI